jgi:hypothetical protein
LNFENTNARIVWVYGCAVANQKIGPLSSFLDILMISWLLLLVAKVRWVASSLAR